MKRQLTWRSSARHACSPAARASANAGGRYDSRRCSAASGSAGAGWRSGAAGCGGGAATTAPPWQGAPRAASLRSRRHTACEATQVRGAASATSRPSCASGSPKHACSHRPPGASPSPRCISDSVPQCTAMCSASGGSPAAGRVGSSASMACAQQVAARAAARASDSLLPSSGQATMSASPANLRMSPPCESTTADMAPKTAEGGCVSAGQQRYALGTHGC